MTPREYSVGIDTAELLGCFTGTGDDVAKLAAVIGQHPAVLPDDDQHWTSTAESEITRIHGIPAGG